MLGNFHLPSVAFYISNRILRGGALVPSEQIIPKKAKKKETEKNKPRRKFTQNLYGFRFIETEITFNESAPGNEL